MNDLLKYYSECLKYGAYFANEIKQKQVEEGLIEDFSFQEKPKNYDKIIKHINDDEAIYIGYPVIFNGKNQYTPMMVWQFEEEENGILPNHGVDFHSRIFKDMEDGKILENIKEEIEKDPQKVFNIKKDIEEVLVNLDLDSRKIYWNSVLFKCNKKIPATYHVSREFNKLLDQESTISKVTESYFGYDLSPVEKKESIYHAVLSNRPQNRAIEKGSNYISVIQGPPGTGKTQTILNLATSEIIHGRNVLISSTNNTAVDNIIEKIQKEGINHKFQGYCRLGSKSTIKNEISELQNRYETIKKDLRSQEQKKEYEIEVIKLKKESKKLYDQIKEYEESIEQKEDIKRQIDQFNILLRQLKERILDQQSEYLIQEFKENNFVGDNIENNLGMVLLNEENFNIPDNFFEKVVYYIKSKFHRTQFPELKTALLKMGKIRFRNIQYCLEEESPIVSIAVAHDVVRYINIENKLEGYINQLKEIEEIVNNRESSIIHIYGAKNEIDRDILEKSWKIKVMSNINDVEKVKDIEKCLADFKSSSKIDKNRKDAFTSFQNIFPLSLTSNLSARVGIPYGCVYDVVIVDEASQCSITSIISLLQIAKRIIFIGDDKQLSHIPEIEESFDKKLWKKYSSGKDFSQYSCTRVSAFDRALEVVRGDRQKKDFLSYHYRCAPSIINFSNEKFYFNQLKVMTKEPTYGPDSGGVHFYNIEGACRHKKNFKEIERIEKIVSDLKFKGVYSIGVITPFKNQSTELKKRLGKDIKVGTIHTFQGGECDAIIMSTVISKGATERQISFAQTSGRLINVALTRAIKLFVMVGDENTIINSKGYLKDLVNYIKDFNSKKHDLPDKMSLFIDVLKSNKYRKELMNPGELGIFHKLQKHIDQELFTLYPKMPVKDTIYMKDFNKPLFDYYLRAHFDFVIYENISLKPICAIEYDGSTHRNSKRTIDNDNKKDTLCKMADFKLLRISSRNQQKGIEEFEEIMSMLI